MQELQRLIEIKRLYLFISLIDINMKKVEYIVDSFVDYTGKERKFVMAAVSIHNEYCIDIKEDEDTVLNDHKILSIGVSVCRPSDEFNEALGKRIAEGKATKYRDHALYAVDAGLINDKVVKALLEQEAEYFKINPGRYLAGYDKDAQKYKKNVEFNNYINNLKGDAAVTFRFLTEADDDSVNALYDAVDYAME